MCGQSWHLRHLSLPPQLAELVGLLSAFVIDNLRSLAGRRQRAVGPGAVACGAPPGPELGPPPSRMQCRLPASTCMRDLSCCWRADGPAHVWLSAVQRGSVHHYHHAHFKAHLPSRQLVPPACKSTFHAIVQEERVPVWRWHKLPDRIKGGPNTLRVKWAQPGALALADVPVVTDDSGAISARRQKERQRVLIVELCYHHVHVAGISLLANTHMCALFHGKYCCSGSCNIAV